MNKKKKFKSDHHFLLMLKFTLILLILLKIGKYSRHSVYEDKKGKAVPLQVWSGPEGSRNSRIPDFMTTAQDGSKVVSLTYRPPLHPGNTPGTHFC
jgi:hypothetical protein